ncbi:TIGR01459 family HAD-type hydrolase [uncultured Paracoccus sp.]|uniref:TIGR01459 family HAD-type hydrolase n=1 Tax=uncultured Paracoccus sp. TaxID=189685 RepID=UPI00261C004D|nr:TIGR01459 family HAD-type hydrolase [uncultured Paracoccus sp.]
MTRIIDSLAEIADRYDVLFCDLWGCVHNGKVAYPAAIAALQAFRRGGGRVALMTNAPRPRRFVTEQIGRMGVPRDAWDDVVTSGDAAQDAMLSGRVGRKLWHVGPDRDLGFFTETADPRAADLVRVPMDQAEGIVVTGPDDDLTETPEDYRERLAAAQARGLPLLCVNPDIVVDFGEQRLYCAGALAQLYEELGGESLYFGKPHAPIYDLARQRLGVEAGGRELAIGDGIGTDIAGAVAQCIDSLFVTGGLAAEHMGADVERPEPAGLASYVEAQAITPTYAIGRLR